VKKELKITLITVFTIATVLLITEWILSQTYVMPEMSERTKVFAYGNIDDVREYLDTPRATVTMGNYYFLIDRNKPNILEMMFSDYKLNPDMNIKDKDDTPLLYAASEFKPEIVAVLVKYGADVNYKDPYGMTPLIAASYTTFEHENPASFEITKMLVDAGADINVVADSGKRAIAGALYLNEDLDRLKYLVENGGDINAIDKDGLNYMFYCNSIDCYEYFLSLGLDINSTTNKGESILQRSVYADLNMETVQRLLELGANICHKDNSGDTILEYVERHNLGLQQNSKNTDFYKEKVKENRQTDVYQYLERRYNDECLVENQAHVKDG